MGIKSFFKNMFCSCSQSTQEESQVAPFSPEPEEQARHRSSNLATRIKEIEAWSKMFYGNAEKELEEEKIQDEKEQKMVDNILTKVAPPLTSMLVRASPIYNWSYLNKIDEETARSKTPSF